MKRRKRSLKTKLKYYFDSTMSKGTFVMVEFLIFIILLTVVLLGILLYSFGWGTDFFQGYWDVFLHMLDPGVLSGSSGNKASIFVLTIATIAGLIITSTLIAIINNWMENKMSYLKKGYTPVLEEDHVVIIGFNEETFTIIQQLIEANKSERYSCVVVLDEKTSKEEMEDMIDYRFPKKFGTTVVCRQANIYTNMTLDLCNIKNCKSIVINFDNDFDTIKMVLTLSQYLDTMHNDDVYIIALLREMNNYNAAKIAGQSFRKNLDRTILIYSENFIARVIAQSSKQAGLSEVFTELFNYEDNEIYIEHHPEVIGKTLLDINTSCPNSIVLGILDKSHELPEMLLNPGNDLVIENHHDLILLQEDNDLANFLTKPQILDESVIREETIEIPDEKKKVLILGYNKKIYKIIAEMSRFLVKDSRIHIVIPNDINNHLNEYHESKDFYLETNPDIDWIEPTIERQDIFNAYYLEKILLHHQPDTIITLSEPDLEAEESDARTLLLLLLLKELIKSKHIHCNITSEMRKTENQKIATVTEVDNFIVGSNIANLMISQVSQTRGLWEVFSDIIDEEGAKLSLKPWQYYLNDINEVSFYTAQLAVSKRNAILLGYQFKDNNSCIVNPPREKPIDLTKISKFIILTND